MNTQKNRRSILFYSALDVGRWDEVMAFGSDMVAFDLEDGTAANRKDEARALCLPYFERPAPREVIRCLRINHPRTAHGLRDLLAVIETNHPPDAIILPKVSGPEEVTWVADLLDEARCINSVPIELVALVESQAGLRNAGAIASASDRVSALFLGAVDLSGELGTDFSWDALHHARSQLVVAASEAHIDCIDGPWLDPTDLDGLREETARVAAMGFTGRASYDSVQIPDIHAAFTPSSAQVDYAKRMIAAVNASADGIARVDGKSTNKANLKGAERILALARRRGVVGAG